MGLAEFLKFLVPVGLAEFAGLAWPVVPVGHLWGNVENVVLGTCEACGACGVVGLSLCP